ncbi:MAG TPA: VCBS repeat-containing protein [Pedobacter sp.]
MNFLLFLSASLASSCINDSIPNNSTKLFTSVPSGYSKLDFKNTLKFDKSFNIFTYRSYYNGGGVGLADFNNDDLIDVFLTGNMQPNKLYLNKGNFKFEDISEKAGINKSDQWSTGVAIADVNADGFADIYICNSGDETGKNNANQLYINNKNLTFTEKANEYGVADQGLTTHAAFFDYDRDNDLDLYILNNSNQSIGTFNLTNQVRTHRDSLGGDKLLRNDKGKFVDVSKETGIYGSVIGFGMGLSVADIDNDGWQDIYISNDFFERDYLYINNQKGGFTESLTKQINSISASSMGVDIADINNDGQQDIFVTEMLPESEVRLKTNTSFENWDKYIYNLNNGYHHQFSRNTLQLNNGNNTFSEIGRYAGIEASDWSWGPLIADFDNDGLKDIFIANGIYLDVTNQDYIQYLSSEEVAKNALRGEGLDYEKLVDLIPSNPISNYAYRNNGNLTFSNVAKNWGLEEPGYSNGSAYADFDNDGDLDLVINNVNMPVSLYRNESRQQHPENNYLKVKLIGQGDNTAATGAKVTLHFGNQIKMLEQRPGRGFQSTVDSRLNFGLGQIKKVDSIIVAWPNGKTRGYMDIKTNQELTLNQDKGVIYHKAFQKTPSISLFKDVSTKSTLDFKHQENPYTDFDFAHLIFQMHSTQGPCLAKADVNADGLEDVFIGGASGQAGSLFIQNKAGSFIKSNQILLEADSQSEDVDCQFFDADNDSDQDLFVCSGGSEFKAGSPALKNRLYVNNGKGIFSKSAQIFPPKNLEASTSCIAVADYDGDQDLDIFLGERLKPFAYGRSVNGYILQNDGKGIFRDVTPITAPDLKNVGMITDAQWFDYNRDGKPDLVITGEYMPIRIFLNAKGTLQEVTSPAGLESSHGWWNKLAIADVNNDGYPDIIAGNHGLNSRFRAGKDKPVTMYSNDFDKNGVVEQLICTYNGKKQYPLILRHDLVAQIPSLQKKYFRYEQYKEQTVADIFSAQELNGAIKLEAYNFESSILINNQKGAFRLEALPIEAQFSPIYGILADDIDQDGKTDLLLGGNFYQSKPDVGIYDASYGLYLRGLGNGKFKTVPASVSGLSIRGAIRDIIKINRAGIPAYLIAINNDHIKIYSSNGRK